MFLWILITTSISAFLTSCAIGANDVANSFATSVGAKVLTLRQAVVIAAFMELAGAILMGSHVTDTLRKGIVDSDIFTNDIYVLMFGMLCASVSTGVWLAFATYFRAPVSTTHSTVGSIIGFALAFGGIDAINWSKVWLIIASWVISPLLSGILTLGIFCIVKYGALRRDHPLSKSIKILPFMVFITLGVNTFFIIYKGTPSLGLNNTPIGIGIGVSIAVGVVMAIVSILVIKYYLMDRIERWIAHHDLESCGTNSTGAVDIEGKEPPEVGDEYGDEMVEIAIDVNDDKNNKNNKNSHENSNDIEGNKCIKKTVVNKFHLEQYDQSSEKLFSYLQIFTAAMSAFAHGANDVANSIGPYAAVVGIYFTTSVTAKSDVPIWVLVIGGSGIAIGLAIWGKRVIQRMGQELVCITPSRGFAMELGASLSVVTASRLGIPVSTTHCQVGSIVGGGLADGRKNVNWLTFLKVVFGWIITLPVTAGVSAALFSFSYFAPK